MGDWRNMEIADETQPVQAVEPEPMQAEPEQPTQQEPVKEPQLAPAEPKEDWQSKYMQLQQQRELEAREALKRQEEWQRSFPDKFAEALGIKKTQAAPEYVTREQMQQILEQQSRAKEVEFYRYQIQREFDDQVDTAREKHSDVFDALGEEHAKSLIYQQWIASAQNGQKRKAADIARELHERISKKFMAKQEAAMKQAEEVKQAMKGSPKGGQAPSESKPKKPKSFKDLASNLEKYFK